jgi:hypothetical protein
MAGFGPAIHVLATDTGDAGNRVDARVKPAHDDLKFVPIRTHLPVPIPRTALRLRGNDELGGTTDQADSISARFDRAGGRPGKIWPS